MPNDSGLRASPYDPDVAEAALAGLLAPRKTLPPRLFYDEEGCRLFYRITEQPEYYLTRAEKAPLAQAVAHLAATMPAGATLIEYGASDETKAMGLLRADGLVARYVPVDVAAPALDAVRARLAITRPGLRVTPIAADFMRAVPLPRDLAEPRLGFFPGSTIGNLEPEEAVAFLRRARAALGPDSRLLLGADLRKDPSVLIPAYDDAAGVTAAFNRNLLVRLNREAGAGFDPMAFRHQAVWNGGEGRIEMHLVSAAEQTVTVAGRPIRFARGESIHTENSYKHTREGMLALARDAGWDAEQVWTDPAGLFAVYLFHGRHGRADG